MVSSSMARPTLLGVFVLSLACARLSDDGRADVTGGVTTGESGEGPASSDGDGAGDAFDGGLEFELGMPGVAGLPT